MGYMICNGRRNPTDFKCYQQFKPETLFVHRQTAEGGDHWPGEKVMKRITKRAYQFQKKENEAQFMFNSTVQGHIETAKKEVKKVLASALKDQKMALTKAMTELNKSMYKSHNS